METFKMITKYIIRLCALIFFLGSTGCADELDLAKMEYLCENHFGLYNYQYSSDRSQYSISCNDGTVVTITIKGLTQLSDERVYEYLKQIQNR